MKDKPTIFWIDLFCGAGGTTTGIQAASGNCRVIACVNHDKNAILSHQSNHPDCLHLTEDVRDPRVLEQLAQLVNDYRANYPGCYINLWASLECTNYSKAKGGLPRDADSRTLAHHLLNYVKELSVDYLFIENVVEFMAWGPLDDRGRPVSRKNGRDFLRWKESIAALGYCYDHRVLNAADFGGHTIRKRYFAQFSRLGHPVRWPVATHRKHPEPPSTDNNLFGDSFQGWRPVREVLDMEDEGISIFNRRKPLAENTLKRIYAGLQKYVGRCHGGRCQRATDRRPGTFGENDGSGGSLSTDLSQEGPPEFLSAYYTPGTNHSVDDPSPTLRTRDTVAKISCSIEPTQFMASYYSSGGQLSSVDQPNPALTTVPKQRLISVASPADNFIDQQYGCSKPVSTNQPAGALTANPKLNLVSVDRIGWSPCATRGGIAPGGTAPGGIAPQNATTGDWLLNPQFFNKGSGIDNPAPTLIARMDKKPQYLEQPTQKAPPDQTASGGDSVGDHPRSRKSSSVPPPDCYENSPTMVLIRSFMSLHQITDIKMRMLKIVELLRIQGFPDDYALQGTLTDQKKFIGNSVHTLVARKIAEANYQAVSRRPPRGSL